MLVLKFILNTMFNVMQPEKIEKKKKKKKSYNQCNMQVEQGTFRPLVFSIYGGMHMHKEYQAFYSRLTELLAEKRKIHKYAMMHWIRSKLC